MIYYYISELIFLVSIIVNFLLKKITNKYSNIKASCKMNGLQIAKKMLKSYNINNKVNIISINGILNDYYDCKNKTVALSNETIKNKSIISIAIAAHECGHAIQDTKKSNIFNIYNRLIPILSITSNLSGIFILIGISLLEKLNIYFIFYIGIIMFSTSVIISCLSLPIEVEASKIALNWLKKNNIFDKNEYPISKKVLKLASLTYLLSILGSITQINYLLSIYDENNED